MAEIPTSVYSLLMNLNPIFWYVLVLFQCFCVIFFLFRNKASVGPSPVFGCLAETMTETHPHSTFSTKEPCNGSSGGR